MLDRRAFLKASGAAFAAGLDPLCRAALAESDALFVSACKKLDGGYAVALFTERGAIVHVEDCPGRAHDATVNAQTGQVAVFARRPGTFAIVFDPSSRTAPTAIVSAPGRHFYGHGVFSRDGRLLYTTENDFDAARGVVGIYEASDRFRRIGEFDTHGIGPHEVLLAPDGYTLLVANGGIETHPDFGRSKLNLDRMRPSLVFIDSRTGELVERHACEPRWHQLSLRHLSFDTLGALWFGCQYEGPASDAPPLIGKIERDAGLKLIELPEPHQQAMRNYVGSVAANRAGDRIAFSSPRGNVIVILDARGQLTETFQLTDGCGLAAVGGSFLATSGEGEVAVLGVEQSPMTADVRWDNHIVRLSR